MNYDNFSKDVQPGERILLDDGKLIFEVISTDKKEKVETKVIQGGKLKSKKGVNLPNTKISLPALTEKDVIDAEFAIKQEVDWIALSFVRYSEDILDLKKLIEKHSDHKIPIIAKIEKPEGIDNIDKIISYCDGLMVARGDLGVEIPRRRFLWFKKSWLNGQKSKDSRHNCNPDDGEYDRQPYCNSSRSKRCCQFGNGWSRRRNALRGNFHWRISRSGYPDHEFHHSQCGKFRSDLCSTKTTKH